MHMKITFNKRPDQVLGPLIVPEDPRIFEDAVDDAPEPMSSGSSHYKMMCNVMVNGKRTARNSRTSKSIVEACAADGIHLTDAFGEDGSVWNCFKEAQAVQPGDIAHMYYGDLDKKTAKHFVGKVLSPYKKFSSDHALTNFPNVNKVWAPHWHHDLDNHTTAIFCRVDWKEVNMTPEDEYMLKNPGKNGFKVQGTILRIR